MKKLKDISEVGLRSITQSSLKEHYLKHNAHFKLFLPFLNAIHPKSQKLRYVNSHRLNFNQNIRVVLSIQNKKIVKI